MARVTVEDCMEVVTNRFELVALASQRTKSIAAGAPLTIDRANDKNAVVALREIAAKKMDIENLRELLIRGNQKRVRLDSYGVDETGADQIENLSDEVAAEMASMQATAPAHFPEDDDGFSYGDDDVIGGKD
jgi:DNA-directed RNA polymerase subunit omega